MTSILNLIGNTPLAEIQRLHTLKGVQIFGKLEGQNPGGSVKDRAAFGMINEAWKRGDIRGETQLVEATSGNTGIALAMIAAQFGISITLVMPESATKERIQTMQAYGAKVILTPDDKGIEYSREYAEQLVQQEGAFMLNQFGNDDNWRQHYKTTGPEIWRDTEGKVTHFVSSMGTTGTIMGVSRYLKEQNPDIQIIGVQPEDGSRIPGIRRWSPAFLPKIYESERVDRIIDVSQKDAVAMTKRLASEESIFAGISSGGAMTAALRLAEEFQEGLIVSIVCDRGDRYLSSGIFEKS
ncbi:MAG: cysteine synthase CysM [Bacteroidota bacterium]